MSDKGSAAIGDCSRGSRGSSSHRAGSRATGGSARASGSGSGDSSTIGSGLDESSTKSSILGRSASGSGRGGRGDAGRRGTVGVTGHVELLGLCEDSGVELGVGEQVNLVAMAIGKLDLSHSEQRIRSTIPSGDIKVVDGVGSLGGINASRNLLVDTGVDGVVHEVDVEARRVGSFKSLVVHSQGQLERNILNTRPLHDEGL